MFQFVMIHWGLRYFILGEFGEGIKRCENVAKLETKNNINFK